VNVFNLVVNSFVTEGRPSIIYHPNSEGCIVFGSVCLRVCVSVSLSTR